MKLNHRMLLITVGIACLFVLILGVSPTSWAQQTAGSITGLVTDASGAAVAYATVTVRDVDRGTTWVTKTTAAGLYEFPTIPQGRVEVKVEAAGFATEVRNPFDLIANQAARVDLHLKLGTVNQTINVNDAPPLLQTDSTVVGANIDANAASTLPLASRDINQLTLLAPGVLAANIFAFQSPQTTFGTGRPYVNGAREQDDNFIVDGMDDNQADNDEVSYVPAPDAVQEMNIITSNAPADYGNYAGGVIVETLKSGTNKFHGNLYEYVRNTDLDANTWQDKAVGFITGYGTATEQPRPVLQWNNFGGTIGGPIIKNKLFFFADEESSIFNVPKTANQNSPLVPSASFYTPSTGKLGSSVYDLGWYCTSSGGSFNSSGACVGGGQLYMPSSSTAPTARPIIPYDQIPVASADPVAKALVALPAFQNQVSTLNYFTSGYTHNSQGDMKIDWEPTQNDHIMGRYTQMFTHVIQSNGTDLLSPNLERQYPFKNIVGDYVRTITPTLINDFRAGTQIFPANDQIYTSAVSGNINTTIGLQDVPVNVLPSISMGYGGGTVGGTDGPEVFHDTTNEIQDEITWTHGRHSLHSGFQFLHYDMNDTYAGNNGEAGQWTFTGQYTNNTGAAAGFQYADFLLGLPGTVGVGEPVHFNLANSLVGGFVQDDFQATPHLTLNMGVRYEVNTPRGDRDKAKNINFDLVTGNPEPGTNYDTYYGLGDIQPRFGFAWQPSFAPRTVLRGAFDISSFMEGNGISNMAVINPPNSSTISVTNLPSGNYPAHTFSNGYAPYQASCTTALLLALAPACIAGETTHATDPHLRPSMNQQWNFTVQHQFMNNFTASLGYIGDKDDHQTDIFWFGQKELSATATQQVKDEAGNTVTVPAVVPGPYMQNLLLAGAGQPRFNGSSAVSRYEALEFTLSQRSYHGLDLWVSYTWSKCLSDSLGYFGSYGDEEGIGEQQNEGGGNFFQNEYNPIGDYGKCTIDAAGAFTGYALYNLPFGRGKMFGSSIPKAADEVIGGWNVAFDTTLRSGFAVTPYDGEWFGSFNPAAASNLTAPSYVPRADCNNNFTHGGFNQSLKTVQIGSSIGVLNLNPAAVSPQEDGQFGTCQVGALRGPNLTTLDMDLNKTFNITERVNTTFTAQFMNLTNTPIFSIPNTWDDNYSSCEYCTGVRTTGPTGGGYGTVGVYGLMDGSNPGREIEFAVKLQF